MRINRNGLGRSLHRSVATESPPEWIRTAVVAAAAEHGYRSPLRWPRFARLTSGAVVLVAAVTALLLWPGGAGGRLHGAGHQPPGRGSTVPGQTVTTPPDDGHTREDDRAELLPLPVLLPDPAIIQAHMAQNGVTVQAIRDEHDGAPNQGPTYVFETSAGTLRMAFFTSERARKAYSVDAYPGWHVASVRNVRLLATNDELASMARDAALAYGEVVPEAQTTPGIVRLALALRLLGYRVEAVGASKLEALFPGYRAYSLEVSHPDTGVDFVGAVILPPDAAHLSEPLRVDGDGAPEFSADGELHFAAANANLQRQLEESLRLESVVEFVPIEARHGPLPQCPALSDLRIAVATPVTTTELLAVLPRIVERTYTDPEHGNYVIGMVAPATSFEAGVHGEMPGSWCGEEVRDRTWLIGLTFPDVAPSTRLSAGQLFVSQTNTGWLVWYVDH